MILPSNKSTGRRHTWRYVVIGALVIVAGVGAVSWRGKSDAALKQSLLGTWKAVDPNDAALHRRDVPVASETIVFRPDGELTYWVELESNIGAPEKDLWEWKVRKGRVYVRFLGDEAGGQWLPGFVFSVSRSELSIRLAGHPPKKFTRG